MRPITHTHEPGTTTTRVNLRLAKQQAEDPQRWRYLVRDAIDEAGDEAAKLFSGLKTPQRVSVEVTITNQRN